jgi:hypothetical protein
VKIALFWDCYSAFHYFRVFFLLFSNLCSWVRPHLGKYFSLGCYFLLHLEIVQYLKSEGHNVLSNLDGNIIRFSVFSMFLASVNRKRHPLHFWWKEPRQYTYWDLVETNVWHT